MTEIPNIPEVPESLPESPLAAISPEALNELMAKDPNILSDEDVDNIILFYRQERSRFAQLEAEALASGKKRVSKKAAAPTVSKAELENLSISNLNVEI